MADFSKTITNSIVAFGSSPSSKWNELVWGVGYWGEGSNDLPVSVQKLLSNSQSLDTAVIKKFTFNGFNNSIASTFEGVQETLRDSAGYYHIFVGGVTDGDERAAASYTIGTVGTTTYTQGSRPSTSWS